MIDPADPAPPSRRRDSPTWILGFLVIAFLVFELLIVGLVVGFTQLRYDQGQRRARARQDQILCGLSLQGTALSEFAAGLHGVPADPTRNAKLSKAYTDAVALAHVSTTCADGKP